MKQTAVEWLNEMLRDNHKEVFDGNIWEQAKAMEKEQMNKMYDHAMLSILDGNGHGQNFEEYYNETFKSE